MFQNSLRYDITASNLQTFPVASSVSPPSCASSSVHCVSHTDCAELVKSGQCQQFLGRFACEFVPTAYVCMPVRLDSEVDLVEMMTKFSEKTLLTYATPAGGCVSGMSCSISLRLMTRPWHGSVYFQVQYFGDELDDAVRHVEAQLRHVAAIHRGLCVLLRFCFPACIDSLNAARQVTSNVLSGSQVLLSERGYLVSRNVAEMFHGKV